MTRWAIAALVFALTASGVTAQTASSVYTRLDFDDGCRWDAPASQEEAAMGGSAVCAGYATYPVYFAESDLRQFTAFGDVSDLSAFPGGFAEWNSVNETIEWRVVAGVPKATILRWFIENIDPETAASDPARLGQVLVIATVADGVERHQSCPVGYVDAKANDHANRLARQVADGVAPRFRCGIDRPRYYGMRGPLSGTPNDLAEE